MSEVEASVEWAKCIGLSLVSVVAICCYQAYHADKFSYDSELVQLRMALAYYQGGGR